MRIIINISLSGIEPSPSFVGGKFAWPQHTLSHWANVAATSCHSLSISASLKGLTTPARALFNGLVSYSDWSLGFTSSQTAHAHFTTIVQRTKKRLINTSVSKWGVCEFVSRRFVDFTSSLKVIRGCASAGVYAPTIYSHARWELP